MVESSEGSEDIIHAHQNLERQQAYHEPKNNKYEDGINSLVPWTPAPVSQSGPKFQELTSQDKSINRRLHHNLGHPTASTLSKHLAFQAARQELIEWARDYQCRTYMERCPPKKGSPGVLKPAREFNEVLGIDGFE